LARRPTSANTTRNDGIESEKLKPIRVVTRELTRPDGTTVQVEVPVYPPFQLKQEKAPPRTPVAAEAAPRRKTG